ncbi:MAG TPA: sulfurtransferase [Thioalkalivibrio sp.]|nr:sulfurtransferase [Thioalkalivibrio sp.]
MPNQPQLEISVTAARELAAIGLAVLMDIRQPFELALEGEVEHAVSLPLFRLKQLLGHQLTEDEQELLDADEPDERDIRHFLALINQHHIGRDQILLCLCNSGRRSLHAAALLRELGYARSLSVRGGIRAWHASPARDS